MELRTTGWFAPTLKLELNTWGNIDGADSRLNPDMVHTANPSLKAGTRVDIGIGANIFIPEGPFHDLRFAAEANIPFSQDLDGLQMETDWVLTFGIQYTM